MGLAPDLPHVAVVNGLVLPPRLQVGFAIRDSQQHLPYARTQGIRHPMLATRVPHLFRARSGLAALVFKLVHYDEFREGPA